MSVIPVWPHDLLIPAEVRPNLVPFTRTGGRSLGGAKPSVRTDLGYWSIDYAGVLLHSRAQLRTWEAIKDVLSGSSGRIAIPVWSHQTAPRIGATGSYIASPEVPHDDDTEFSDETEYEQGEISVVAHEAVAIGATTIMLRIINAEDDLAGVLFSYNHALYRTGQVLDVDGDVWTMRVSPSVVATIPAGASLEFDLPTCLCNLADDRGMDNGANINGNERVNVSFVQDMQYWNILAVGGEP
ncbi:hypothetical protein [Rhizobium sp. Root482]|uniref:hypothetical protein n=1 Tax=Rhizobium sp. Root482 TaxID=1736543 RepID=UPI0006F7F899|nr:hypothetical protein [Rhizobium sp. Root482]KQY27177.1 hypothetical protein ASD31_03050 [Rhizobium sp. Root482]